MILPRLPAGLIPIEVAFRHRYGRPWWAGPSPDDAPPLRPEDLTPADRRRLRQRAAARRRRIRRRGFRNAADWFWLGAELALGLPQAPKQTVRHWRQLLHWAVYQAEQDLDRVRRMQALVLGHEPETDAWLRRQLAALDARTETVEGGSR